MKRIAILSILALSAAFGHAQTDRAVLVNQLAIYNQNGELTGYVCEYSNGRSTSVYAPYTCPAYF